MYSCIAGFMDPGEPLEECVRREVAEEVKQQYKLWCKKHYSDSSGWSWGGWGVLHWLPALAVPCRQCHDRLPCSGAQKSFFWSSRSSLIALSRLCQARPPTLAQLSWRMLGTSASSYWNLRPEIFEISNETFYWKFLGGFQGLRWLRPRLVLMPTQCSGLEGKYSAFCIENTDIMRTEW